MVGLGWVRFHDLRHFYLSHMASGGIDIGRLQELAGHANLKSTQRYTHYSDQSLKSAVEVFVPKSFPKDDPEAIEH